MVPAVHSTQVPEHVKRIITQGDGMWSRRRNLDMFWQRSAENFYIERADFTVHRAMGQEFGVGLTTSVPLLARRDLGEMFSSMLRPNDKDWFAPETNRMDKVDHDGRAWLQYAGKVMRRAMYDPFASFTRATKEGDNDFVAFGQTVLHVGLNTDGDRLIYRCYHLRDVVWEENAEGQIDVIHRKWKPAARILNRYFKGRIHPKVTELLAKEPERKIECRHIVMPIEDYEGFSDGKVIAMMKTPQGKKHFKYVSLMIDVENQYVMEEVPIKQKGYVIPRWLTVSGHEYAYSPAITAGLREAELLQAQTLTLLEASEKSTNPPLKIVHNAIRSDINTYAGGATYVADDYDEKTGAAIEPFRQDYSGIEHGMSMYEKSVEMMQKCFYLDRIGLPPAEGGDKMTATEVQARVSDYIRRALPLFEPVEQEYNAGLCQETFDLLMSHGAFGSPFDIPRSLRGQDVQFNFYSPLHDAQEKVLGPTFQQAIGMLNEAVALDPTCRPLLDIGAASREAVRGIGAPESWLRDQDAMDAINKQVADQQQQQAQLANIQAGANAAKTVGEASQAFQGAQGMSLPAGAPAGQAMQ